VPLNKVSDSVISLIKVFEFLYIFINSLISVRNDLKINKNSEISRFKGVHR